MTTHKDKTLITVYDLATIIKCLKNTILWFITGDKSNYNEFFFTIFKSIYIYSLLLKVLEMSDGGSVGGRGGDGQYFG